MNIAGISFSYSIDSMAFRGLKLMDYYLNFETLSKVDLPICDSNKPDGIVPQSVHNFSELLNSADVLVFSIPEYTGHYSAAFKNALDWLVVKKQFNSTLGQDYCISQKPIYVITFTPSHQGAGHRHFEMTSEILQKLGAQVKNCFVKNNGWETVIPLNYKLVQDECNEIKNTSITKQLAKNTTTLDNEVPTWINAYNNWNNKWK